MNSKADFDRAVHDWVDEGSDTTPPEVIGAVLLAVRTTPQERDFRIPWKATSMTSNFRVAAVIAFAIIASTAAILTFGPGGPGFGGTNATPSSSPALIARGSFVEHDWGLVEFEATRAGSTVSGHMAVGEGRGSGWPLNVDFQCSRTTEDGLVMIGGVTTNAPGGFDLQGQRAGIVLKRGSAVRANVWVGSLMDAPATQTTDCEAYLDAWLTHTRTVLRLPNWIPNDALDNDGTVEFGP